MLIARKVLKLFVLTRMLVVNPRSDITGAPTFVPEIDRCKARACTPTDAAWSCTNPMSIWQGFGSRVAVDRGNYLAHELSLTVKAEVFREKSWLRRVSSEKLLEKTQYYSSLVSDYYLRNLSIHTFLDIVDRRLKIYVWDRAATFQSS